MASEAVLVIRVRSQRGSSRITYSTKGRYVNLSTNGLADDLARQPIQPTSTVKAFWQSVIAIVTADINASPLASATTLTGRLQGTLAPSLQGYFPVVPCSSS